MTTAFPRLSAADLTNLAVEAADTPMHVGLLAILDGRSLSDAGARLRLAAIRVEIDALLTSVPELRRIVHRAGHASTTAMVHDLDNAPVSMADGTLEQYLKLRDTAMHRLGIGTTHAMKSVITGIFLPSLRFPEYTIAKKINLWRGKAFSGSFGLWDQFLRVDLRQTVPRLDLPTYFLEGAYDYTCSYSLALDYFHKLSAPVKGFYRFDNSAHSPIFEQPALAKDILRTDVLENINSLSVG